MNRGEAVDRMEQHERPDAAHGEGRSCVPGIEDRYEGQVLERLEAHEFFDPRSLRWYRALYSQQRPGEGGEDLGDVEFLYERGLVAERGDRMSPTLAAVLVFGRARYVLQVLPGGVTDCQFIGTDYAEWSPDRRWTDRIFVESNLLQAWRILERRYLQNTPSPFRLDPQTMRRIDEPPGYVSFREGCINQLIHQDYADCGRTAFIRLYRDRTVFWNPGDAGAPAGELLGRTAKEVRNPLIAAAFRGIGLARQAGTGMRAIFANWEGLGHVPPVIRSDEVRNEFELSMLAEGEAEATGQAPAVPTRVPNMVSDRGDQVSSDMVSDQAATWLTARQRAIVAACDVPRSLTELMERAGVSHRSHFRQKHLKPLLDAGLVRMTNPDNPRSPNQRYVVVAHARFRSGLSNEDAMAIAVRATRLHRGRWED